MARRTTRKSAPDEVEDANASDQPANRKILDQEAKDREADHADDAEEGVERTPDGGAIIDLFHGRKKLARQVKKDHGSNLVEDDKLKEKIATFASKLWDKIQLDIQSATKAEEMYAKAIGDTGLTGKADGGAAFPGASTVTHPILGEVCADYSARVTREMISPKGPAKPHIEGAPTKEKWDRAKRVARHMNWQTRKKMRNFSAEIEQGMAQQPFSGAVYVKLWGEGKNPKIAFIPKDKVHRPASDDDFYECERITHEYNISDRKMKKLMFKGVYVQHDFGSPAMEPQKNKVDEKADKVAGVEEPGENVDGTRKIYETSCWWDGESEEGDSNPYILTMDEDTKTPLAMYRNWDEKDEECERLDFLYEFGFMPFRGGKPIGLAQMLAGIPRAATGALRALLDSAHANNVASGSKLKGGQSGSTTSAAPGTIQEIENATQTDDIRKLMIQNLFNPPSPVLFQLLGFLVDAGRGMVRTTFDDIVGKGRQDIPVGTMMMLVDEGTVVFSSIFARQHRAMGRLLEGLYRLNGSIIDNAKFSDGDGDDTVTKFDYVGDSVVVPVSDPRINSDTQRWTRANFLAERAKMNPAYNQYEVEKSLLEAGQIENIDLMLNKPQVPVELSAPNENIALVFARPIMAYPDQNHMAHIEQHIDFAKSPLFGQSKAMMPQIAGPLADHLKGHLALEYGERIMNTVDDHIKDVVKSEPALIAAFEHADSSEVKMSVIEMMKIKEPRLSAAIDKMFAAASGAVMAGMQKDFASVLPMIDQLYAMGQQFKPPTPMDPTAAGIQVATIGAQSQTQVAAGRKDTEDKKVALTAQELAQKAATDNRKLDQADRDATQDDTQHRVEIGEKSAEMDTRHQMNVEDNSTAISIANAEIEAGHKSALSTGTGIG